MSRLGRARAGGARALRLAISVALIACQPGPTNPEAHYVEAERRWICGEVVGLFDAFYHPDDATRRYFRIMEAVAARTLADPAQLAKARDECKRWDMQERLAATRAEAQPSGEHILYGRTVQGGWARIPGVVVVRTSRGWRIKEQHDAQ